MAQKARSIHSKLKMPVAGFSTQLRGYFAVFFMLLLLEPLGAAAMWLLLRERQNEVVETSTAL